MKQTLKRLLSTALALAMLIGMVPTQAFAAQETEVYLPEIEIGPDILDHDVFYLATAAAEVREDGSFVYLLKVGRGGEAESESTALVKIADMTAKYGEDYVVRVRDLWARVENPKDNFSLMEMMEGSDFEQGTLGTEEEFAEMLGNDPEAQEAYLEGTESALEFLDEASGLKEKYGDENPYAEAEGESSGLGTDTAAASEESVPEDRETLPQSAGADDPVEGAIPADPDGEVITFSGDTGTFSPLSEAAALYTGEDASVQRLTAEGGELFKDLQAIANVMTDVVVGAHVALTFKPGETEKYLEIVPKDNSRGDGDRMFYVILGAPEGETTNSAASACAVTILDDEEQEPAYVSFSEAAYWPWDDHVTVTVLRSGAMNTVVTAKVVTTGEGSAEPGRDYSAVDAELVFPFGVDHLTLDIPVRTEYLSGTGDFELALEPAAGCETGENASAIVYLNGSYTGKASLTAAVEGPKLAANNSAALGASGGTAVDRNNLSTLRTLDAIDISKPVQQYKRFLPSVNQYDSGLKSWRMYYCDDGVLGAGNVSVAYWLTEDYWTSYFLSGAQVRWSRTYGGDDKAWMYIALAGSMPASGSSFPFLAKKLGHTYWYYDVEVTPSNVVDFLLTGNKHTIWPYAINNHTPFTNETRFIYPVLNATDPSVQGRYVFIGEDGTVSLRTSDEWLDMGGPALGGDHPQAIGFANLAKCSNCNELQIHEVMPVLRPFQVNIKNGDALTYLMYDGTRSAIAGATTTNAELAEAGSSAVYFMNDTFTVKTTAGSNVNQYSYMTKLNLLDGKDESRVLCTLADNDDPSNTSIAYALNTASMEQLIKTICPDYEHNETQNWFNLLRENTQANPGQAKNGYATYAQFNIRPEFAYLDASVTLRNPYEFPVTMTISGTSYTLAAGETRKITAPDGQELHKGDMLAVSRIRMDKAYSALYDAVGVRYWGKFQSTAKNWDKDGTWNFIDHDTIYVSGTWDNRLNFSEVILEPNLQVKNNRIIVRVKTADLNKFDTTIVRDANGNVTHHPGVLATEGTVDGEYTNFIYADTDATVNGKLYAVTATPKNSGVVCVWEDGNTRKTYEGNTFYYTAGNDPKRNIITLSVARAASSVTLEGTLRYANYNLRTGYEGNESQVPAVGAVLSAGSAGGVADADGHVTAGRILCSGLSNRYLRYLVSVNGADMVQEILLPTVSSDGATVVPNLLYDFNSDEAENENLGKHEIYGISYFGETDSEGNDYYTFTADKINQNVSLDSTSAASVDSIQWVKIRARNLCGTEKIVLARGMSKPSLVGLFSMSPITLASDKEWHEYVYNMPDTNREITASLNTDFWSGEIEWVVLYPIQGNGRQGDRIQIDYIAFFDNEDDAKSYVKGSAVKNVTLDISANFKSGVSPVTSAIFSNIRITGTMSDSAYQIDSGSYIPVVLGKTANMTVSIKEAPYKYTVTDNEGYLVTNTDTEHPFSVQFAVYDKNDVFRFAFDPVDNGVLNRTTRAYDFSCPLDFVGEQEEEVEIPVMDEDGNPMVDENGNEVTKKVTVVSSGTLPEPGDKLYLRLVTDRLAQTEAVRSAGDKVVNEFQYSDVFTGMYFYQPVAYEMPPAMGIKTPINLTFGELPLVGSTGMNLNFPFVNVGVMKITNGYRIYIGFSPVQMMDAIKGTHVSSFSGAGKSYWKSIFKATDPFNSFAEGIKESANAIGMVRDAAKDAKANNEKIGDAGLGGHSWRFDIAVGVYFDFINVTVTIGETSETKLIFNGIGGYVSVTLGFQMAWYIVLPIVFLPAYFGIEMQGTVMGFLGADLKKDVEITYDDAMNGSVDINDGIDELNGCIRGLAYVQISAGIGLCGTLGIRGSGKVDMIANWEPGDPNGDWGFYVSLSAGFIIDLFLFSIPLMFNVGGWPFGSFEYYANNTDTARSESSTNTLQLRQSSGYDSMWLGDQMMVQGAFRPNKDKQKLLVADAYERPDSQTITLSDGETVVLAFIDSDNAKGETQRTTLKMATYAGGMWSEAVTVSNDKTADFQPSLGETKDGRVLVAWVSPSEDAIADLSTDQQAADYLSSMEVYAAFVELDENKRIRTRDEDGVTVADTEVTRISNDHYTSGDRIYTFYDANPTVVCDMESGDAMVYYIKSEETSLGSAGIAGFINPYVNGSHVYYMPYNAETDEDNGREIPAGWLFDSFYYSEMHGNEKNEKFLIDNLGGQRTVAGPTFTDADGNRIIYAIPDFTAVGYNGLAIFAYTADVDGSNDSDEDKELYLQVYDFRSHELKYRIRITDDDVSDTLPQFFRSRVNAADGMSTDAENTHTKLFWYRDGKNVVYIDVTALLRDGINADGTLKTEADDPANEFTYTDDDGTTHYRYTEPRVVYVPAADSNASAQAADFRAIEDSEGNLYVLWTENTTDEEGSAAREIIGTGLVGYETAVIDEEGNAGTARASSGWSKPYRITRDGWDNDEIAVAMSGENLMVVHNRFHEGLVEVEGDYNGQVDFMPIQITDMALVADVLEPCGSVETGNIALYRPETVTATDESGNEIEAEQRTPVTLPVGGETISVEVEVANNGMNPAEGYKLSLYADETPIGDVEVFDTLLPNGSASHTFDYELPSGVDGLTFKAVVQEMRDASGPVYYNDRHIFTAEPLEARAAYEITGTETYQTPDGFHVKLAVTNTGNAASSADDTLTVKTRGPANLEDKYTEPLYKGQISLSVGETAEFDLPVNITPEMMEEYGFVTALITVQKEVMAQNAEGTGYPATRFLSNLEYADFDLVVPMNMTLGDVTVEVDSEADIAFSMDLGDQFRSGGTVTYAVDDLTVAQIRNGKVFGVNGGETILYATHTATGATVSSAVTVTGERKVPDLETTLTVDDTDTAVTSASDDVSKSLTLTVGDTGSIEAHSPRPGTITYASSDPGVVTVDENGRLTAVGAGTAVITVTLTEEETGKTYTASYNITVNDEEKTPDLETAIIVDGTDTSVEGTSDGGTTSLSLIVGDTGRITASSVHEGTVTYASSNPAVVTVDENGRLTAVGAGTAVITVTLTEEGTGRIYTVTYTVKVSGTSEPGHPYDPVDPVVPFIPVIPPVTEPVKPETPNDGTSGEKTQPDEPHPAACDRGDACPLGAFADLDKTSWYHDGVEWALINGVMNGVGEGLFDPDGRTNRAMIVTMLHRMEGAPVVNYAMDFTDVEDGMWYTEAIRWAAANEIVTGYGDGRFGPTDPLTREQLATILYRCAKAKGLGFTGLWAFPLTFDDASEVSDWAYEAVCWMVMQGVIQGTGNNKLSPKGMASRAQVATMLMRYNAAEQELLRQTMEAEQFSRQTAVSTLSYEKGKARNSTNEMN